MTNPTQLVLTGAYAGSKAVVESQSTPRLATDFKTKATGAELKTRGAIEPCSIMRHDIRHAQNANFGHQCVVLWWCFDWSGMHSSSLFTPPKRSRNLGSLVASRHAYNIRLSQTKSSSQCQSCPQSQPPTQHKQLSNNPAPKVRFHLKQPVKSKPMRKPSE